MFVDVRIVLLISRKGFHFILKAKKKVVSEFVNPRRVVLFFLVILIVSYNQNSVQLAVVYRYISSKWRDRPFIDEKQKKRPEF
jgi:hypothetical protein